SKRCARTEEEPTSSASTVATRANLPWWGNGSRHRLKPAQGARRIDALRRRLVQRRAARSRRALWAERSRQDDAAPDSRGGDREARRRARVREGDTRGLARPAAAARARPHAPRIRAFGRRRPREARAGAGLARAG